MQESDFVRFHELLTAMAELYQRELSKALLDVYWLALKDWSINDFQDAAGHLMATATFMPRPSDFNALKRAGELTAGEAWDAALAYCRKSCRGESPGGRIDRAARAIGGYNTIGHAKSETQLPFIERNFKEAYDEFSAVEVTREKLPQLMPTGITSLSELQRIAANKAKTLPAAVDGVDNIQLQT